ncbi:hypothetical protein GCM10020001_035040 [Nonomuraea salmonea]
MRPGLVSIVPFLALASCGLSPPDYPSGGASPDNVRTVTRIEFGKNWPLTTDSAQVRCDGPRVAAQAKLIVDGTTYGLNGNALNEGLPRPDPVWADDPGIDGAKISIGPLIDAALDLCRP